MIHALRLQNFKAIRDIEVSFERLTVLVGPNGSGKTSILQGIELFSRTPRFNGYNEINNFVHNNGYRDHFSSDEEMQLIGTNDSGTVLLGVTPTLPSNSPFTPKASPNNENLMRIEMKDNKAESSQWVNASKSALLVKNLDHAQLCNFNLSKLREPSLTSVMSIDNDGTGLHSFLAFLALSQPDKFHAIQQEFSRLIPTAKRIRFDRTIFPHSPIPAEQIVIDLTNGKSITARSASEGTLLVLAMIVFLLSEQPNRSNIILIDDIDRGLHPLTQRNVIELLRKFLNQQPDLQIIATTHSPYLVDCLQPEEVRMTTLNDDGTVACGQLVDHPNFRKWKDEMAPGELWSMFGEKWVSASPKASEPI